MSFKRWFFEEPFTNFIIILLMMSMGSCTAREIYCDWTPCGRSQETVGKE